VALAPIVGASCLRAPQAHVSRLPDGIPAPLAAALYLSTMSACYALHRVADLTRTGTVLVHGALSAVGRAAVAVARSIGARIAVTATDPVEARTLTDQLGITSDNVFVVRPSLSRRPPQDIFPSGLDAIIHSSASVVPEEVLACLKPFGYVVVLQSSAPTISTPKLPRNAAIHFCDVAGLLRAHPDRMAGLTAQASAALEHFPTIGLDVPIRDVADIAEASRLVKTGVCPNVVLQAGPDSYVQAVMPTPPDGWIRENASYVVAGGLGDLGRRLLLLIARRGAQHVVTLSRRVVEPEDYRSLQAQIEAVRPGCRLHCLKCDVTSESSTRDAAAELVRAGVPPVRGVIQSSALLQVRRVV
jgi:KR domain